MRKFIWSLGLIIILVGLVGIVGWKWHADRVASGKAGSERLAVVDLGPAVPDEMITKRTALDRKVVPTSKPKQILFGDLHVHSTYSTDAFTWALPINQGKGMHPVADACDYARYCSAIDFWSITDHAEGSTPLRWQRTKDAIRQCNAKSADANNPDLVSLIGFEWTQVGVTPEEHFGHKNVIFEGTADHEVSARPIAADSVATSVLRGGVGGVPAAIALVDWENSQNYYDFNTYLQNIRDLPNCDPDKPSDELPLDCFESTKYPEGLIRRLEEQGLDPLIIPHGTSWGFYTPQGTSWDKQLRARHRPEKFSLIELYSGHGNSEEYRDFRAIDDDENGKPVCPSPHNGYTPPCWRAGELIEARCDEAGLSDAECQEKVELARHNAAKMGTSFHLVVEGETPEEWLESGQCKDCYLPPFHHRPKTSVQYGLAISNFDDVVDGEPPARFNWGFIASSDNHRARAGTGYKEVARRLTTEAAGPANEKLHKMFWGEPEEKSLNINHFTSEELIARASFQISELERQTSFWQTGGLVAVHSDGRDRASIFEAMRRKETYATSGPRMLLWFDRIGVDGISLPMGSTLETSQSGRFKVKAVGSFKQKPGCPEFATSALGENRIDELCSGECYHPSDERNLIERIEIIRIRPQVRPDEQVGNLIDDVFLSHDCPPDPNGCEFEFSDPEFDAAGRDTLYYARAIQEPRPTINAEPIQCERDAAGNCIEAKLCYGDYRSGESDCTSLKDVRAWSSPIYVNFVVPPIPQPVILDGESQEHIDLESSPPGDVE